MAKIDYKEAWEELKEDLGFTSPRDLYQTIVLHMEKLKQKHTHKEKKEEEGGYLFRDDGGYGTEMIKKYKTYKLIEYIQDLCYTSDDRLKINEIRDRLLELDKIKQTDKIKGGETKWHILEW